MERKLHDVLKKNQMKVNSLEISEFHIVLFVAR